MSGLMTIPSELVKNKQFPPEALVFLSLLSSVYPMQAEEILLSLDQLMVQTGCEFLRGKRQRCRDVIETGLDILLHSKDVRKLKGAKYNIPGFIGIQLSGKLEDIYHSTHYKLRIPPNHFYDLYNNVYSSIERQELFRVYCLLLIRRNRSYFMPDNLQRKFFFEPIGSLLPFFHFKGIKHAEKTKLVNRWIEELANRDLIRVYKPESKEYLSFYEHNIRQIIYLPEDEMYLPMLLEVIDRYVGHHQPPQKLDTDHIVLLSDDNGNEIYGYSEDESFEEEPTHDLLEL